MKVLITGGHGNLGRLVAAQFIDAQHDVVTFDLPGTTPPDGVADAVVGDMQDTDLLARTLDRHQPDAVVHLASLLSGSSEANPELAWAVNATASITLMRMAKERGNGPFVFASTLATYGACGPVLKDDAPQWPDNVYGATKVAVERMGVWMKQSAGFDFRCLRFPMVLSPFAPPGALTAYPSHAFKAAATGHPFTFPVARGTGVSTLMLDDVTRSLVAITLADRARLTGHAYNLHGFHFTAGDLADKLQGRWPGGAITFQPDARVDALISGWPDVIDDAAARADWDWMPAFDFDAAFAAMCERV